MFRQIVRTIPALLFVAFFAAGAVAQDPTTKPADPMATLEEKLNAIDLSNADQLFEVASWAVKQTNDKVRDRGRKFMREIIELDTSHEGARKFLGHVKVGDTWYDDKNKASAAIKAEREREMKEKGLVPFQGGWIKPEDKGKFDAKKWVKDSNDVWRSEEAMRREAGQVLYKGVWLTMSEDDRKRMESHRKKTGDDILVVSTQHFRLHLPVQPKSMERYAKLAEHIYDWFMKEFNIPEERRNALWPRPAHFWTFWTLQQYHDWITSYSEEYQLKDDTKDLFRRRPGGWQLSGQLLQLNVTESKKDEDIEDNFIHSIGHFLLAWYTNGQVNDWMMEAFANLLEEKFSAEKIGKVSCSTVGRYGGGGDIAKKEFNTKDARPSVKQLVRAKEDPPLEEMSKADLNSLNGEMLSKGYSIVEWLYTKDHDKFLAFFQAAARHPRQQDSPDTRWAQMQAIVSDVFEGKDTNAFEELWRAHVLKTYK